MRGVGSINTKFFMGYGIFLWTILTSFCQVALADTIYYTDTSQNKIFKAEVNESGTVDASTLTPLIEPVGGSEPRTIRMAQDENGSEILVWTERKEGSVGTNRIGTADLDGTNIQYIYSVPTAQPDSLENLAVDPANPNLIYWGERRPNLTSTGDQKVQSGNIDSPTATNVTTVITSTGNPASSLPNGLGDPEGMDIDADNSLLYLIGRASPTVNTGVGTSIKRFNTDGSGGEVVVPQKIGDTQVLYTPLFLHVAEDYLWWSDIGDAFGTDTHDSISRVKLADLTSGLPLSDLSKIEKLAFEDPSMKFFDPMDFFVFDNHLVWINLGTEEIIFGTFGSPLTVQAIVSITGSIRSFDYIQSSTVIPELPAGAFGYIAVFLSLMILWFRRTFLGRITVSN